MVTRERRRRRRVQGNMKEREIKKETEPKELKEGGRRDGW